MILTFLDAGVLIDGARGKAELAEKVFAIIDDPNRQFVSASFVELEVLPKAIHNKQVAEEAFYRAYFEEASFRIPIDEALIRRAMKRAERLGLNAVDAVHLEAAITAGAAEFITTEKPSKPFFRETAIKVISVQNLP